MSTEVKEKMTEKDAIALVKSNGYKLQEIPMELRTEKVVKEAINFSCSSTIVQAVPTHMRTFDMVLRAAPTYSQKDAREFAYRALNDSWGISVSAFVALVCKGEIPNMNKVTDDAIKVAVYKAVVKKDHSKFIKIPTEFVESVLTKELALKLIVESGRSNFYGIENYAKFPESFKNDEEIVDALQDSIIDNAKKVYAHQLSKIDPQYMRQETYKALVQAKGDAIQYFPDEVKTKEICEIAVKYNGRNIKYVPVGLTADFYRDVVNTGAGLDGIPEYDRTDSLCTIAVEKNPMQLEFVPEDKKSYALCLSAIDKNCEAIQFVPVDKIDDEIVIRFLTSLLNERYSREYHVSGEYREGNSMIDTLFNNYFGEDSGRLSRKERISELFKSVIEREPKLYFKLLKFSGVSNEYEFRAFHKFFQGTITFEHAVIAARKDISVVSGFSQDVHERVWKFFLHNSDY